MSDQHGYVHRGTVLVPTADGVFIEIPALAAGTSWGPIPTAVPDLATGEAVLVAQIGSSADTLVIVARVPGRAPGASEIPGLADLLAELADADTAIEAAATTLAGRVTVNEGHIATNTANIATNTSGIATNAGNVASNTTRITALEALRHRGVAVTGLVSTTASGFVSLGSDDVSLTLPYPASGIATVHVRVSASTAAASTGYAVMGFEIRDNNAAGTLRVAASDINSTFMQSNAAGNAPGAGATPVAVTVPTTGTMFIRAMYKSNSAGTASFSYRGLVVQPSP